MRTEVLILTGEEGDSVTENITDSLRNNSSLSVRTVSLSVLCATKALEVAPHILIAVIPADTEPTSNFLRELRSLDARTSLLLVCNSKCFTESFFNSLACPFDFLFSPFDQDELMFRVERLIETGHRKRTIHNATEACGIAQLIGEDPKLLNLKRRIPIVARFDSTVLITGETGTGKERLARALHYSSARAAKPFLPVNCGAIPIDLFESELYGHRRGAFTGAVNGHQGLIAEAEGGTLFLDEVETLTMASQVKLLRFLQDHVYYPVGSATPKQANVWILASTNIELPLKIQDGTFREDLYYRLAVISLALPPLRQRNGDIRLLAEHFWKMYSARAGREYEPLSAMMMDALGGYDWPGNVRELQNVIQQLAISESESVTPEDLSIPCGQHRATESPTTFAKRKAGVIADFEKRYLTELLRAHGGNVTHAAQDAGKDRRALGRLIKKHRIPKHQAS